MKNILKFILLSFMFFYAFNIYAEESVQEQSIEDTYVEEVKPNVEEEKIEDTSDDNTKITLENTEEELLDSQNNEVETTIAQSETADLEEEKDAVDTVESETENVEEEKKTESEATNSDDEKDNTESYQYEIIKVKVITTKVDEDGLPLPGAVLQILDSNGKVVDEWTTDGKERITNLPDGVYTLHEKEAPEGYELAEDKTFTIKIEMPEVSAGVDFSKTPCPHYGGTPLYYVEIEGKKQEVYCINQNWEVPDENSIYDGEILNPSSIRDFTKQTVPVDAANNKDKIDISDHELKDEQLYNKILDIIYHRHKAEKIFSDLSIPEIRFLTESALKNYTNAGLTEAVIAYRKSDNKTFVPLNVEGVSYDERSNGDIYYLRHQYRDYVYTPDAEMGKAIYEIRFGEGNSFGQMVAYHWSNGNGHHAKTSTEERNKIARYYELYQYLISEEDTHPDDMNLFIYSTESVYEGKNPNADYAYQNLLGITGYFEEIKDQEELELVMENKYSTEKRNISVAKIWDDNNDEDEIRPKSVKVYLLADNEKVDELVLSEDNNWESTFENLDVYKKGKKIEYTISEEEIEFYESTIVKNNEEKFTITNYHEPWPKGDGDEPEEPKNNNPKTGDDILTNIIMLLISLTGLTIGIKYLRKN